MYNFCTLYSKVDTYDTFWAKVNFCLAGSIFLVELLEKRDTWKVLYQSNHFYWCPQLLDLLLDYY